MKIYRMEPPHDARVNTQDGRVSTSRVLPMTAIARRHSPTGFSWGYHGSGPAALAAAIIEDVTGEEPQPFVYQAFKVRVVAEAEMDKSWSIDEHEVRRHIGDILEVAGARR